MSNNLDKIKRIIESSSLSNLEKADLLDIFSKVADPQLGDIAYFLSENPSSLKKLINNLEAKRIALSLKDRNLWQKILKEEESELEKL